MPQNNNIGINPADYQDVWINWDEILREGGEGAATGGAIGSAIGSIIPGLGTAIGEIIGNIIGALASIWKDINRDQDEMIQELLDRFVPEVWSKFWGVNDIPKSFYKYKDKFNETSRLRDESLSHHIVKVELGEFSNWERPKEENVKRAIEKIVRIIYGVEPVNVGNYPPLKSKANHFNAMISDRLNRKILFFGRPDVIFKKAMSKQEWLNVFKQRAMELGDALPEVWAKAAYDTYFGTYSQTHKPRFVFYEGVNLKEKFDDMYNYYAQKLFCERTNWQYPPCAKGWKFPKGLTKKQKGEFMKSKLEEYRNRFNEWLESESQRQYSDSGEIGPEIKKKNDVGKMLLIAGLIYLLTTI